MSNIPVGWTLAFLGDVVEVHDYLREPVNARERKLRAGIYPYYGATGQVGWIDSYRQDGEFVLLGEDGAPFFDATKPKAYIVFEKCWVNNHAHVLKGVNGVLTNRYLLHTLNATDYREFANGTTRLKLTRSAMVRIPIKFPPILEQGRIVDKIEELFSELDAGIASLHRAKANLKRYRASVLKAAVEGRLTAAWRRQNPPGESGEQLLARILKERRAQWEENQLKKFTEQGKTPPKNWQDKYTEPSKLDTANLSELPEGWVWCSVEQLGVVQLGRQRSPKNRSKIHPVFYLRAANITESGLELSDLLDMEFTPNEQERYKLQFGDLLLSEASGSPGQVGKPAIWQNQLPLCCFQNTVIRLRPSIDLSRYLLICFRNCYTNKIFAKIAGGVGINHLSADKFSQIPVPLPSISEQRYITTEVERRLSQAEAAEKTIEQALTRAARLRQAILKRAFEGRLVPQEPNDEPASALLERIRAERAAQTKPRRKTAV